MLRTSGAGKPLMVSLSNHVELANFHCSGCWSQATWMILSSEATNPPPADGAGFLHHKQPGSQTLGVGVGRCLR